MFLVQITLPAYLIDRLLGTSPELSNLFLRLSLHIRHRIILVITSLMRLDAPLLQNRYSSLSFLNHRRYARQHSVNVFPFLLAASAASGTGYATGTGRSSSNDTVAASGASTTAGSTTATTWRNSRRPMTLARGYPQIALVPVYGMLQGEIWRQKT